MKKDQFFFKYGMLMATLCAVLGLLLFIPAATSKISGLRIFFGTLVAISLMVGVVFLYLSHHAKRGRIHYFLYDERRKQNLSMRALTPELILEKVNGYLSDYTDSVEVMWQEIPKKLRLQLDADVQFLPLIAYRMLLELSEKDDAALLDAFQNADSRAVGYVCRAIRDAGDEDLADYVFGLKKNFEENQTRIPTFFHKNKRLFEDRMLRHVEHHVSDFYMDVPKI